MLKNAWFQIHWFIGITAGVVLAVVGVTGAALSFEHELKQWMNPGVMSVAPKSGPALSPADMLAQLQAAHPDRRITSLSLSSDREQAGRVVFAAKPGDTVNKRGETFYLDPYSGELLGKPSGEEFFRLMMQVHRWLAAGDIGKQIVGASTMALVVLCLSGLYLRWPRSVRNWRAWLALDFRHKGRSFLWELHAVAGTWALVLYLLAALTGLYWSYDWYRHALFAITGAPRPAQQTAVKPAATQGNESQRARAQESPESPRTDLAIVWPAFQREVSSYQTVTLRLPEKPGQPVQVTYLDSDPAHDRANNRLVLNAQSGAVLQHERYSDKPVGAKVMSSMLALHSGSFFGMPGLVLMMLASLLMPLFAITGWMLYLDRRKTKKNLRAAKNAIAPAVTDAGTSVSEWLIGFASQTGFAEQLAWQTAGALRTAGVPVTVEPLGRISQERLGRFRNALFVVSTFGEGEPPDHARSFAKLMHRSPSLSGLRFGLLALGNSRYKTFCGFGRALDHWLRERGAQPLFERVEIDNGDPGALTMWQSRLGTLADVSGADWTGMPYRHWRLAERRLLNPGSAGGPTFHVVLEPNDTDAPALSWKSGDLVDIIPRHADKGIAALKPLPPRQYSIASIPQDGAVHLLIRQVQRDNGLGIASGWLTEHLPIGAGVEMRIRSNTAFHFPPGDRPLILIGNGTGLAGLRSHLKARAVNGHRRNWLIFGERNAAHDYYHHEEIEEWQEHGLLERLDLVFSRDQPDRIYVQDRLRAVSDMVREWVAEGASILVCGSLEGMAPGVDRQLAEIIGADRLERLVAEGRYRRDVY